MWYRYNNKGDCKILLSNCCRALEYVTKEKNGYTDFQKLHNMRLIVSCGHKWIKEKLERKTCYIAVFIIFPQNMKV